MPAIKTLAQFDFAFQPSIRREKIESLHELGTEEMDALMDRLNKHMMRAGGG